MTGKELREARKAAGISMKQAAEESGTPYRTWQDWEAGNRRVPGLAFAWLKLYRQIIEHRSPTIISPQAD